MTLAAILILAVSALLHASWNFISKKSNPSAAFLLVANATGCMLLAPVAIIHASRYSMFPGRVWVLLLVTGVFMTIYYASLAGAYRSGDMSLAYPLARSSPVIVVAVVTFLLGQGDTISTQCVVGILLVVAGCFMVPMKTFRDFRLKNYLCPTCGLALLAAIGTTGYSIADAEALGLIRGALADGDSIIIVTILYALAEALSASVFMLAYVCARKAGRAELVHVLKAKPQMAVLAGVGIYVTYTLVLISMSWAKNVSYVVGFRQLSIPIGVVMGVVFLKEPVARPKILGVMTLVIGLVLIALG